MQVSRPARFAAGPEYPAPGPRTGPNIRTPRRGSGASLRLGPASRLRTHHCRAGALRLRSESPQCGVRRKEITSRAGGGARPCRSLSLSLYTHARARARALSLSLSLSLSHFSLALSRSLFLPRPLVPEGTRCARARAALSTDVHAMRPAGRARSPRRHTHTCGPGAQPPQHARAPPPPRPRPGPPHALPKQGRRRSTSGVVRAMEIPC